MPVLEEIAVMNVVEALPPFFDTDVAASQTDVQLVMVGAGNVAALAPRAGWLINMTIKLSAAASAGSLTVGLTINGVEVAATTQTITTETEKSVDFNLSGDAIRFVALDDLGVEITTDGSWDATTADLDVILRVLWEKQDYH